MFYPKAVFQGKVIKYLKESVIDLPQDQLEEIYSSWHNNFATVGETTSSINVVFNKSLISNKQNIPEGCNMLGIDFPIWFNDIQRDIPRIMVMGIDPLRNSRTFHNLGADKNNEVIIGTPYALHNVAMRDGKTKQYWQFVSKLSKKYFVYLTDIYKVFFYLRGMRSYDYYRLNNNGREHIELLEREIKSINPDLIITLGGIAFNQLTGKRVPKLTAPITINEEILYDKYKVIPMVHLSGSVRQNIKRKFLDENKIESTDGRYGEAYYHIIDGYIQNTVATNTD